MHARKEGDPNGGSTGGACFSSAASSIIDGMDNRAEVREFLVSRRGRITPEQVGLPDGRNRRVSGLRRSEVAMLAGVSVEYYTRLEQGALSGASLEILDGIAKALHLDDAERAHLFDLAQAASPAARPPRRRDPQAWRPHPSLQWLLDGITAGPAFVRNGRLDLLAVNSLARAFYKDAYDMAGQHPNLARFTFLDERSRRLQLDWDSAADVVVSILRTEAGRDPHDDQLQDLVRELSTHSDDFRRLWNAHNVRHHGTGYKRFCHPVVGELTVAYEGLEMASEPGLTLTVYTAEPGSASEEALRLLGNWAATEYPHPAKSQSRAEA